MKGLQAADEACFGEILKMRAGARQFGVIDAEMHVALSVYRVMAVACCTVSVRRIGPPQLRLPG